MRKKIGLIIWKESIIIYSVHSWPSPSKSNPALGPSPHSLFKSDFFFCLFDSFSGSNRRITNRKRRRERETFLIFRINFKNIKKKKKKNREEERNPFHYYYNKIVVRISRINLIDKIRERDQKREKDSCYKIQEQLSGSKRKRTRRKREIWPESEKKTMKGKIEKEKIHFFSKDQLETWNGKATRGKSKNLWHTLNWEEERNINSKWEEKTRKRTKWKKGTRGKRKNLGGYPWRYSCHEFQGLGGRKDVCPPSPPPLRVNLCVD